METFNPAFGSLEIDDVEDIKNKITHAFPDLIFDRLTDYQSIVNTMITEMSQLSEVSNDAVRNLFTKRFASFDSSDPKLFKQMFYAVLLLLLKLLIDRKHVITECIYNYEQSALNESLVELSAKMDRGKIEPSFYTNEVKMKRLLTFHNYISILLLIIPIEKNLELLISIGGRFDGTARPLKSGGAQTSERTARELICLDEGKRMKENGGPFKITATTYTCVHRKRRGLESGRNLQAQIVLPESDESVEHLAKAKKPKNCSSSELIPQIETALSSAINTQEEDWEGLEIMETMTSASVPVETDKHLSNSDAYLEGSSEMSDSKFLTWILDQDDLASVSNVGILRSFFGDEGNEEDEDNSTLRRDV